MANALLAVAPAAVPCRRYVNIPSRDAKPIQVLYILLCDAGLLIAETMPDQPFLEASQVAINVDRGGPFPYRILYAHSSQVHPGITLRWSGHISPSAASLNTTSGVDAGPSTGSNSSSVSSWDSNGSLSVSRIFSFQNIPPGRLFTDAKMERAKLLTGSISGVCF
jgi:hypothetical protein